MAQRGIREYDAKALMARYLPAFSDGRFTYHGKVALVGPDTDLDRLGEEHPWLRSEKLVVKPDQLFGKRGKHKLILVDAGFEEARQWIGERMSQAVTIGRVSGKLTHFLIEPHVPHTGEHYVAIKTERDGDRVFFSMFGGIYIEENWDKVRDILVPIGEDIAAMDLSPLLIDCPAGERARFEPFLVALHRFFADLGFAYLELNPFVVVDREVVPLDAVARLDDAERFKQMDKWGALEFPAAFGREPTPEEAFVMSVDERTGASLKLTVLNPRGRVWTMIAGGGASVIYTDTVVDLGFGQELANYGEYSGDPNTEDTYLYARTILDLMTREKDPRGKFLLIGGGIANFTDVASTFTGIIMALKEYQAKLREHGVRIFVRRGGPNYKIGLDNMRQLGDTLGVPIQVYGPETHMTHIVSLALQETEA